MCTERNSLVIKLFQKILKRMIFLQPLIQNFWQRCKSCLLRVQRIEMDVIFRTWLLIPEVFFWTWAGFFEFSSEKICRSSLKLHPTRWEEQLSVKKNWWKTYKIKKINRWDKNFRHGRKKWILRRGRKFGVKITFWKVS